MTVKAMAVASAQAYLGSYAAWKTRVAQESAVYDLAIDAVKNFIMEYIPDAHVWVYEDLIHIYVPREAPRGDALWLVLTTCPESMRMKIAWALPTPNELVLSSDTVCSICAAPYSAMKVKWVHAESAWVCHTCLFARSADGLPEQLPLDFPVR